MSRTSDNGMYMNYVASVIPSPLEYDECFWLTVINETKRNETRSHIYRVSQMKQMKQKL